MDYGTKQILLAKNFASPWKIVKKANASPSEEFAAEEFCSLFGQITGVTLPVLTDDGAKGKMKS